MATQDEYIKTALRLPRDLHAEIQASAAKSARSMNAEIVSRLQDSGGTQAASSTDGDALLLAARLQAELAKAHYQEHLYLVKAETLAESIDELLRAISDQGLTEKISREVYNFDNLEKFAHEPRYAKSYLEQLAEERDAELETARRAMDAALAGLAKQQSAEGSGTTLLIDKVLVSQPYYQQVGRSNRQPGPGRDALVKNLAATVESVGQSRTPSIPGVNAPKRGSKRTDLPKK